MEDFLPVNDKANMTISKAVKCSAQSLGLYRYDATDVNCNNIL